MDGKTMAKFNSAGKWIATALVAACWAILPAMNSAADDTELFTQPPGAPQPPPNVMIFVDSSANWNANNQGWATGKQGEAELRQIKAMVGQLSGQNVAVGLMLMTSNTKGAYVRVAPRNLSNPANATAVQAMAQSIYDGNFGSGTPGSNDQVNTGSADYSAMMYEVYNYYSGAAPYSGYDSVYRDFTGNTAQYSPSGTYGLTTGNALASASAGSYLTPLSATVPCAKNYLVVIGNGLPNDPDSVPGGSAAKIASLSGGVVPSVVSIPGNAKAQAQWMDEWAKFIYSKGAKTTNGINGSIVTYTIDVYKNQQDLNQTALFKSAARVGGGRYFAATDDSQILTALTSIFDEIQSVSSVFSAATLPVSVNVRGTNLNQVYLGVFRPDVDAGPNWPGNLKAYKLGLNAAGGLELVDSTGAAALSSSTGFFRKSAISFWTASNTYWTFDADPGANNPNSDSADGPLVERGGAGQMARWNIGTSAVRAAADRTVLTHIGASPSTPLDLKATPSSYGFTTSNAALTPASFGLSTTAERDATVNWIRGADLNDANGDGSTADMRPRAHGDVIHSRPAVINYNRYGDDNDVAVYYGANDGLLHAIQGGQVATPAGRPGGSPVGGGEFWTFAASEFFTRFPRQANNSPSITWATIPATFTGAGNHAAGSTRSSIFTINANIAGGQMVTGSGVPVGATVSSVSSLNGVTISAAATASASGTTVNVNPPGAETTPINNAKLTAGSNYVTLVGGGAPPAWLVPGMTVADAIALPNVVPGSTVTSVTTLAGAGLAGGVAATSANASQVYTFSNTTPVSNTLVDKMWVIGGQTAAYREGSSKTSLLAEVYSSTNAGSTLGANVPGNSTIAGGAAANVVSVPNTTIVGTAGAVDSGVTLTIEDPTATSGATDNAIVNCSAATCTINYFTPPLTIPIVGDRVNIAGSPASWTSAVGYPTVASANATSVTLNRNSGVAFNSIPRKSTISFYKQHTLLGAVTTPGQVLMPYSGSFTRGGVASTMPTGAILKKVAGTSATTVNIGVGIATATGVAVETLSSAATASAYGAANYVKPFVSTVAAVCQGSTVVGGTSITALGSCTTGTVASIAAGQLVSGPGIAVGTTTVGVVNPGFSMSNPASGSTSSILYPTGQAVTAFYPWTVNMVGGAAQLQVSSPIALSLASNGWSVKGVGMASGTTIVDRSAGLIQFVDFSTALTSASPMGGTVLTFTNPTAGATAGSVKPYFFDGPIGVYRYDAPNAGTGSSVTSGDGKIIAGQCNGSDCDQAIIFVPMRRGGRMVYAFDVTDPNVPKLLWKKGCTASSGSGSCDAGFEELGATWSIPQAYNYNINGVPTPVLVFGGGYDSDYEDQDPVSGSRSMGRSIVFLNAKTGVPIKVFKGVTAQASLHVASAMTVAQTAGAAAMTCAIPADVSVLTKDASTGFTVSSFRAYVGDTCGQMWRVDTADTNPDNWIVSRLASVGSAYYSSAAGGALSGNSLAVNNRKFFFGPDVVYGGSDVYGTFHHVLVGSGDREHPFNGYGDAAHPANQAVVNRFYMFKDYNVDSGGYSAAGLALSAPPTFTADGGGSQGGSFPKTEPALYDATADLVQVGTPAEKLAASSALGRYGGWSINLSTAEKVVGGATSSSGYVYFGTNRPATVTNACTNNLGEARLYEVAIGTAGAAPPVSNGVLGAVTSATQRYEVLPGGGLPPTPVPVAVNIDGTFVEGVIAGTKVSTPATSIYGQRLRAYTRKLIDKN